MDLSVSTGTLSMTTTEKDSGVKIKKATMRAVDDRGVPLSGEQRVKVSLKGDLRLVLAPDHSGVPSASIRRYITDPDLADERGQASDDPDVLMDWFEVADARVMYFDGTMTLTGYTAATDGLTRDGTHLRSRAGTRNESLTRVKWELR